MAKLAVFDFDHTIVDEDSDATIITRLREKRPPPEYESGTRDWTPYMSDVFEHAFSAGFHPSDILDSIASMRPTPGMPELITTLADQGWDVAILSDANTVFVNHWIKTHDLQDAITTIVTNRAFWRHDRLYIEPCMGQTSCRLCPTNLCKSIALAQLSNSKVYTRLVYTGDGRNDYCPATTLPDNGTVFPRVGYPLDELIKQTLATQQPQIGAKVVPWTDAYAIHHELFPK